MLDIGERMRNKNFSPVHAQVVEVVKIRLVNNQISLYTQPNAGRTAQGSAQRWLEGLVSDVPLDCSTIRKKRVERERSKRHSLAW